MLFLLLFIWLMQGTSEDVDDGSGGAGDASRLQVAASPTRHVDIIYHPYMCLCWKFLVHEVLHLLFT